MVKVVFLGPKGTYSHQAAGQQFPSANDELVPADSIMQCFDTLLRDESVGYAVIPLENSTNGQVVFTYDLLRDYMLKALHQPQGAVGTQFSVVAEQFVLIEHCLISPVPRTTEEILKEAPRKIYSHPQVWGQIDIYTKRLFDKLGYAVELCNTLSTSIAVEECIQDYKEKGELSLAVAGSRAATTYNAHIVEPRINNEPRNTTRFLVLQRKSESSNILPCTNPTPTETQVTLISFTVKYDAPGALVDILVIFKELDINICSISSRPFRNPQDEHHWQYIFFLEFQSKPAIRLEELFTSLIARCDLLANWGTFYRNNKYYS
ncbi:prephenate dehydratase PHA2 Ecym_2030 [Eremothecium cymbalariae DBVPG|uniref:prephenate dehydratase n=1 Tax=Eremothecium cymbalariae (strain CBS 270.75 / DBVPG 7215 / KCTC 17166 / NRRL Y-17582) TaxID=931890 RepID=G8JNY9_ERECY|nr:Hypothetical protein Ecym_2030 [Eremothecium cymbalariae DBVPG\